MGRRRSKPARGRPVSPADSNNLLDGHGGRLYLLPVTSKPKAQSEAPATVGTLSESLEDYLEIILQLQQELDALRATP